MKLYHATPRTNKASILRSGLLLAAARCEPRRIWLCERDWVAWAVEDCRERHHRDDVCVIYLDVPKRRLAQPFYGIYTCAADVEAARIKGELFVEE